MLHLLTKKRLSDFPSPAVPATGAGAGSLTASCLPAPPQADDTIKRIKLGLSRAPSCISLSVSSSSSPNRPQIPNPLPRRQQGRQDEGRRRREDGSTLPQLLPPRRAVTSTPPGPGQAACALPPRRAATSTPSAGWPARCLHVAPLPRFLLD